MSEKAPQPSRFDEALNNFDAKKAEHDQQAWLNELQGEAGITDFSDDARKRLEELREYHDKMEQRANEPVRNDEDNKSGNFVDTQRYKDLMALNNEPSPAYEREWDDAIVENETFDAKLAADKAQAEAEFAALDTKIAVDPRLRRMNNMSRELAGLREKLVDVDTESRDTARMNDLNDKLQELILRYSESDDYDEAIADMFMDRDDEAARAKAAHNAALKPTESSKGKEADKFVDGTSDEPHDDAEKTNEELDAERLAKLKDTDPDGSKLDDKEDLTDAERLEALRDTNPDGSKLSDDERARLEALRNIDPAPSELNDDAEKTNEELDAERLAKLKDTDPDGSELDGPDGEAKTMPWYQRAYYRAGMLYQNGLNKVFGRERGDDKEKRTGTKRMRNIAFGAIALVGVGFAARYAYDSQIS